jgi:hypothetical protein
LWQVKAAIQQRLTHVSGQAQAPIQPIDILPLPVCVYTRRRHDRCLQPYADYGYCATKGLYQYSITLEVMERVVRVSCLHQ